MVSINNSLSESLASETSFKLIGDCSFRAFESKVTYIAANLL